MAQGSRPLLPLLPLLLALAGGAASAFAPSLRGVRSLVATCPTDPLASLHAGTWYKLICGASNQDLASIRNLVAVFALAGADCIDFSADPAVLRAVHSGLAAAAEVASVVGAPPPRPWLMVSVQDGDDDLHFRKAVIDQGNCPLDCNRPCEQVCPAAAFRVDEGVLSVIAERCYGCGRCLPVCPYDRLSAQQQPASLESVRALLPHVDAIEIHTRPGHLQPFRELWRELGPCATEHLRMVAVSTPPLGAGMGAQMAAMDDALVAGGAGELLRMWQLDGRPMSGDVGKGATVPAIELAAQVSAARALPWGDGRYFMSIAGGTNDCTVDVLRSRGLRADTPARLHGVAYGTYARKHVGRVLARLPEGEWAIEAHPELLALALKAALATVGPLKASMPGAGLPSFSSLIS